MTNLTHEHTKIFRAEKTTKNRDDFKVLMVGCMILITMMLLGPMVHRFADETWSARPFVQATVEVVKVEQYEQPMLLYDADATRPVKGQWIAFLRDANDIRLETRRGYGTYTDAEDNPRLWTWHAFFDQEDGTPAPMVPDEPFRVCLRYVTMTIESEIPDETPIICSKLFYPDGPNIQDTVVGDDPP